MSQEMTRFTESLDRTEFQALNGKRDPFDLLSSVSANVGDAQAMMESAGVLGWEPETIPLSGMDSAGNIYEAPASNYGIVVPQYPGGPTYFGQAHKDFRDLLASTPDEEWSQTVHFFTGPKQMGEYTRANFAWFLLFDQIHHRGQLSIYLRMAGGKLPSIYGPTRLPFAVGSGSNSRMSAAMRCSSRPVARMAF